MLRTTFLVIRAQENVDNIRVNSCLTPPDHFSTVAGALEVSLSRVC